MSLYIFLRRLSLLEAQKKVGKKIATACYPKSFLSSKAPNLYITKEIDPATGEEKKRKTKIVPKITLLSGNNINVTTLEEAQSIAKRRDLKLVKIIDLDNKTQRPVYKLMTGTEYHAEELKQKELRKKEKESSFIKGEKVLLLNSAISEHDLETQIKKIMKWVAKSMEVRVVINGELDKAENVYKVIEDSLKADGRIVQKRAKGSDIKFQVLPHKKSKPIEATNESKAL